MRKRSIAALVLMAALVGACGGSVAPSATTAPQPTPATATDAPSAPPSAPQSAAPASQPAQGAVDDVLAAAAATIAEETVTIEQAIEFNDSAQIPDGTTATLVGGTAFTKPTRMAVTADFAALGLGEFDMIVDDQLIYLRGTIVESIGTGKWLLVDMQSPDPRAAGFRGLATGQNDASLLLYFLYGAQEPVERLPDESLDGQTMQVFAMPVDLDAAIQNAPESARASLQANVAALETGGMGTTLQAKAWIGADGLVHRVEYLYTLGAAAGGGTLLTSCVFSDFGAPLDLVIPDDEDVVRLEDVPSPES